MDPFTIHATDAQMADLHERLARVRWPDTVDPDGWSTGTNLTYLQELVAHWRTGYDWRAQEARLNQLPHFRTTVGGVAIHVVHQRGTGPAPLPLILTNGWPSTFYEFHKVIPMLADPAAHGGDPADAFHVVIPSLPGFGFSDRPTTRGAARHIPKLWCDLMTDVLGYSRFGAHGTDIGAFVTNRLGLEHAERLVGIHVTLTAEPSVGPDSPPLTDAERTWLAERERTHELGQAYAHVQRTVPQTLAYGLHDSPAGLAAWILEKWRAWSDCHGDIERRFTKDELLTTIMLYWLTGTMSSAIRVYDDWKLATAAVPQALALYADAPPGADGTPLPPGTRIPAPAAVAQFEAHPPRAWIERAYADLRRVTAMPRGGHFAAMEEPELLVEDIRAFLRPLR